MTEHPEDLMDDIDMTILDAIGRVMADADPVPPNLIADIDFSLSLAAMNAELAALTTEAAAVRNHGPENAESVTFTSSTMTLMVVIGRDDGQIRLDAWVSGGGITIEMIHGSERSSAVSDVNGRVSWFPVAPGLVRFLIQPITAGGRPVITPALEL
jgi:hypothetical protein